MNFTMDKWPDMFSLNEKRQKKIKSILDEYKKEYSEKLGIMRLVI